MQSRKTTIFPTLFLTRTSNNVALKAQIKPTCHRHFYTFVHSRYAVAIFTVAIYLILFSNLSSGHQLEKQSTARLIESFSTQMTMDFRHKARHMLVVMADGMVSTQCVGPVNAWSGFQFAKDECIPLYSMS